MRIASVGLLLAMSTLGCEGPVPATDGGTADAHRLDSGEVDAPDAAPANDGGSTIDSASIADAALALDSDAPGDAALLDTSAPRDAFVPRDAYAGTEILTVSFQSGSIRPALTVEMPPTPPGGEPRVAVVRAPWDPTRYALRTTIVRGDRTGTSSYARSEITLPISPHMAFGTRYRITGGYWFDPSSTFPRPTVSPPRAGEMVGPFQLHGREVAPFTATSPISAMQLLEDDSRIAFQPGDNTTIRYVDLGATPTGRYVAFEVIYVPSLGADGVLQITLDGVPHAFPGVNHEGPRVGNPDGGFFKLGLYDYWNTIPTSVTLYLDDIQVFEE